jgi:hypothetical protein
MKLGLIDCAVLGVGLMLAVYGEHSGLNALSFSGGAFIGGFVFKLGYMWGESQQGGSDE